MGWYGRQCWQSPTRGTSKSVASFCTVEFRGDISISLCFFVLTFFFLANKGSHSKGLSLFFLSFFLTNSHSNNAELIGSGSSSVGPFPPTKVSEQLYVSLLILSIVKLFLSHKCTHFFGRYCISVPPKVRVRATVKLSVAFFHDESSITNGGYESAIAPFFPFFVSWFYLFSRTLSFHV